MIESAENITTLIGDNISLSAMLALILTKTTALPAASHGNIMALNLLSTAVFLLTTSHSTTYSILTVETTVVLPMTTQWIVSLSLLLVRRHY